MEKRVLLEKEGESASLFLNIPKKLNAFDRDVIQELNDVLDEIEQSDLKLVFIRGKGDSFCTGGDIRWEKKLTDLPIEETKKEMGYVQTVFSRIESMPQVFVAIIQGYAVGGGVELAMACDIRIALPSAKFLHSETKLGTVAPLGGTRRLSRLIGLGRAKYLLYTGEIIDAEKALEWGLVDFLVTDVKPFMESLITNITSKSVKSLSLTKQSVNRGYTEDLHDAFELESYAACSRTKEMKEAIEQFLKK